MRVGDKDVGQYKKKADDRRGSGFDSDQPKPRFVEGAGRFPAACVAINHTRSKAGKWGVVFIFMRLDTDKPEFIAYEAWNNNQIHRVIVEGFGWDKGYENAMPDDPDRFNPEADIFNEMWEIATCKDLHKGGKWVPGAKKRSPYVEIVTEIEEYNGDERAKVKWVNRVKEIGSDGPYYINDFRDRYLKAAGEDGPMRPAKAWYQGWYAFCVRKGAEASRGGGGGRSGSGGGRGGGGSSGGDNYEDSDVPF